MTTIMIRTALAAVAFAGTAALAPLPAAAQSLPKLVIYGDQKCPTDASGNEIIVCERRSQEEQFRIPKELRELEITPQNEGWAARAAANDDVGATGTGSCSNVGAGGSTGCFLQQSRNNKATNKARKADQRQVERSLP